MRDQPWSLVTCLWVDSITKAKGVEVRITSPGLNCAMMAEVVELRLQREKCSVT